MPSNLEKAAALYLNQLRKFRNIEAHTYEEDLARFLLQLKAAAPEVLELSRALKSHSIRS